MGGGGDRRTRGSSAYHYRARRLRRFWVAIGHRLFVYDASSVPLDQQRQSWKTSSKPQRPQVDGDIINLEE